MELVKTITPLDNYRLCIELSNGSSAVVDLSSKLETARFGALRDEKIFMSVCGDGDFIVWGGGRVRTTVSELLEIALLE